MRKLPDNEKRQRVDFRIPPAVKVTLKALAKVEKCSMSEYLIRLIKKQK